MSNNDGSTADGNPVLSGSAGASQSGVQFQHTGHSVPGVMETLKVPAEKGLQYAQRRSFLFQDFGIFPSWFHLPCPGCANYQRMG
jgi:hypothetical protein